MYKMNKIGPWPIIDPSATKVEFTSGKVQTAYSSPLQVRLDTANLGTRDEVFINAQHFESVTFGFNTQVISFGACLAPLEDYVLNYESPMVIDVNMAVTAYDNENPAPEDLILLPWVGFIDTAGIAIGDGWHANNLVSNWSIIPTQCSSEDNISINQQIVLKAITSSSLDLDKFVCVGFSASSHGGSYLALDYQISARYALSSLQTSYRGV